MSDESFVITDFDARGVVGEAVPMIGVRQKDEKIYWSNSSVESLFGCEIIRGLRGERFDSLMPERFRTVHESHWKRYWKRPVLRMMATRPLECRRTDGSEFKSEILLIPCKFSGEKGCMVVFVPESAKLDDSAIH
jgi:hypothetical protein